MYRTGVLLVAGLLATFAGGATGSAWAHEVATGGATGGDVSWQNESGETLLAKNIRLFGHPHGCVVTVSSSVNGPVLLGPTVLNSRKSVIVFFGLFANGELVGPASRTLAFHAGPAEVKDELKMDPERMEVSTTYHFSNLAPGVHSFSWAGLSFATGLPITYHIFSSSMTVVCSRQEIASPIFIPPPREP